MGFGIAELGIYVGVDRSELGFVADIAAQKEIAEDEFLEHHLEANAFDHLHIGESGGGDGARRVFARDGEHAHEEQRDHDADDGAESGI